MKRSQMLDRLEILLYSIDKNSDLHNFEIVAESILNYIEGYGMLPPVYQLDEPRFNEMINGIKVAHTHVPEWEPED